MHFEVRKATEQFHQSKCRQVDRHAFPVELNHDNSDYAGFSAVYATRIASLLNADKFHHPQILKAVFHDLGRLKCCSHNYLLARSSVLSKKN